MNHENLITVRNHAHTVTLGLQAAFSGKSLHMVTVIKGWYKTKSDDLRTGWDPYSFQSASGKCSGSRFLPPHYLVMVHSKAGSAGNTQRESPHNHIPDLLSLVFVKQALPRFPWFTPEQSVYLHRPRSRVENHYLFYLFPCTRVLINLELKESNMRSLSWFAFIICSVMFWAL